MNQWFIFGLNGAGKSWFLKNKKCEDITKYKWNSEDTFSALDDLFYKINDRLNKGPCACVFIDEAQFLSHIQVWQLARAVDDLNIPIMCYGLRVDFQGNLFPGSATLLALSDEMREIKTICFCGKKATMVVRQDENGIALIDGEQVQIGGNEAYVSLCRKHWRKKVGQ